MAKLHFVGVAGSGMSPLAQYHAALGDAVSGSDRRFDNGEDAALRETLRKQGIDIYPQSGAGVGEGLDAVIASTAVEAHIPDLAAARDHKVAVRHRSDVLADLVNGQESLAVAGTSGKSTITAMIAWVLRGAGKDPSMLNGAPLASGGDGLGNFMRGTGALVVEADESDGTLEKYTPTVGLVSNISRDHQELDEIIPLFEAFVGRAKERVILGANHPHLLALNLAVPKATVYGWCKGRAFNGRDYAPTAWGSAFVCNGSRYEISVPGEHNAHNALAAIAAGHLYGIAWSEIKRRLAEFPGVHRRMVLAGRPRGIAVIDDYAHNPDKMAALMATLRERSSRFCVIFQWHGYGPARFMGNDMAQTMAKGMRDADRALILPVFYAGGSVEHSDEAEVFVGKLNGAGANAELCGDRQEATSRARDWASEGDAVAIVGARDESLSSYAKDLAKALK